MKHAEDIPAEANNIHITIIWYLAAIRGETPDKICPVIIPGKETNPTANKEFTIGIRDALSATPRASIYGTSLLISVCILSAAILTLFIAPAKIIPAKGIKKRGEYYEPI